MGTQWGLWVQSLAVFLRLSISANERVQHSKEPRVLSLESIWGLIEKNRTYWDTVQFLPPPPLCHKVYPQSTNPIPLYSVQQAADVNMVFLDCIIGPTLSCLIAEKGKFSKQLLFCQKTYPSVTLCHVNLTLLNVLPFYKKKNLLTPSSTSSASPIGNIHPS